MSSKILSASKHRTAKHPFSRVSDGEKHPVTVTNKRERTLEQAADTLTTVVMAAIESSEPAVLVDTHDYRIAAEAPKNSTGTCGCGAAVVKVWHPSLGKQPRWLHAAEDNSPKFNTRNCSMVRNVTNVVVPQPATSLSA